MSTSTWGEPEPFAEELYPPALLRFFLKQMMGQFGGDGACIALYDESSNQMRIQAHVRLRKYSQLLDSSRPMAKAQTNNLTLAPEMHLRQGRRTTINLLQDEQGDHKGPPIRQGQGSPLRQGQGKGVSPTPIPPSQVPTGNLRASSAGNTHEEVEDV